MKKTLLYFAIALTVLLLGLQVYLGFTDQVYLYKTAIYNRVGIEDYKIFSNRTIANASPQAWQKSSKYNKYELPKNILDTLTKYQTVGYVVIHKDSLLHEQYWEGYSDTSLSNSFSVAKSVISLLVGIAIEEGKIKSVDESIATYLPTFNTPTKNKITIKHLLTMSSGLNWDENYGDDILSGLVSQTAKGYYYYDLPKAVSSLEPLPSEQPSGSKYRYKSGDTQLLGLVLQAATGQKIADYASSKIWKKIGAEQPALWSLDKAEGTEKAYCCFNSNAKDFARIGQLVLNNGKWNGETVVPEKWLKESFTPSGLPTDENEICDFYGYQWWLLNFDGMQLHYARGILGQYIITIPEKQLVIVRLGKKIAPQKHMLYKHGRPRHDFDSYINGALYLLSK